MKKLQSLILLAFLLFTLIPFPDQVASAQTDYTTVTIQPDGTAGKDNYISSSSTGTNFGTATTLKVGEANNATMIGRGLIGFDLSGLPYDFNVISATLTLTVDQDLSDN